MKTLQLDHIDSPIGTILIVVDGERLCSLDYADYEPRMMTLLQHRYGPIHPVRTADPHGISSQIRAYFAGDYRCLDAIPFTRSLRFDMEVWHWADCKVGYAATTYWYALPGATHNRLPQPEEAAAPILNRKQ